MESYTLFQLNEYIKRVISLNFQDSVWINAEISQVSYSRGNYYIELIEKEDSDAIKAKASAIIWYKKALFLENKFKSVFNSIIDTGNEIRVKVSVHYSERYGLSLIIEDLDVSYTLGRAEMVRQEILNRLKAEGLIERNAQKELPLVIQRIAVISSETAAGYKDFTSHLQSNSYGYHYHLDLYKAAMQGAAVENEIIQALDQIQTCEIPYDCVVIIRGGGAKLDLAAFDNYNIAKRIACYELPVISGIGHDIDQSITDIVSHTDLKTPTAVADFLIERALHFESTLLNFGSEIGYRYKTRIHTEHNDLDLYWQNIKMTFDYAIRSHENKLNLIESRIRSDVSNMITQTDRKLDRYLYELDLLSPKNILRKGFSILRKNGNIVHSISEVGQDDILETELKDGKVYSKRIKYFK